MTGAVTSELDKPNGFANLALRACPVCGNTDETNELYPQRLDLSRLDGMS